ncbi:MAG: hypothetical protein V1763_00485, partial [Parcubacteria group bacterium]
ATICSLFVGIIIKLEINNNPNSPNIYVQRMRRWRGEPLILITEININIPAIPNGQTNTSVT